jgi:hypothetical protein
MPAAPVRFPTSVGTDSAMMLTSGHCYEGGFIAAGRVIQNVASTRSGTLLNSSGGSVARVRANRVIYATMTGTDVTLYRVNTTVAALSRSYGAVPLTVSGCLLPKGRWSI